MISYPPASKAINLLGTGYNATLSIDIELTLCTPGCGSWDPFLAYVFDFPLVLLILPNRELAVGLSCCDSGAGGLLHQCGWQYMEGAFLLLPFSPDATSKQSALPFPGVQASSTSGWPIKSKGDKTVWWKHVDALREMLSSSIRLALMLV